MTTKRGRPPTGCPTWNAEASRWEARVMLPTGQRRSIPMTGIRQDETDRAKAMAKTLAVRVREGGFVPEEALETVNDWFERWAKARDAKGLSSVRNDRGRYRKWVAPVIGTQPMATVPRRKIEEVVQALDRAVLAKELGWKTSINAWGVCTKMFADACRSKVLSLRCREDNPAREVEGPDRGIERSGPYLFPSEFLALMHCERVPARWKRIFLLSTYLYVRGGELEALEWNSVDFTHGYVLIHQAVDSDTGEVKSTKTKDVRKVPIERALLPLLTKMHGEAAGEGRVVATMPPAEEWAERLRKYLGWAGVTRADLFADDATRRQMSFHDLRHSGITWRAVRGDEPLKIQRAAGHDNLQTTQRYINEAHNFEGASFGEPFPEVPIGLLSNFGSNSGSRATIPAGLAAFPAEIPCPQGDSNAIGSRPETSPEPSRSPEKEAGSSPDAVAGVAAFVDAVGPGNTELTAADLEAAISRLTRALATADDETIADLVAERKSLRTELEARRRSAAGVASLDEARARRRT